jgi:hypothetical protein
MNGTLVDEIWVATLLLHKENPSRSDFSVSEIRDKVLELNPKRSSSPGLNTHLSTHCIAGKPKHGTNNRILTETRRGYRRLFREGDPFDASRENGKIIPDAKELPEQYRPLISWYQSSYNQRQVKTMAADERVRILKTLIGSIPDEDLKRMSEAIEEGCEHVDEDE